MKILLGHIASIQTGIFAKTVLDGNIVYLQAKNFNENGQLIVKLRPEVKKEEISENHLLQHGDVLFAAKGSKNFAAMYENTNLPAVASTSFFVIRINRDYIDNILPEFLVWYFNHPNSQKYLKGNAIGSSIASISKAVLEKWNILIPDLETQNTILKITKLRNTEKNLIHQIEDLREKKIQQQIINSIN